MRHRPVICILDNDKERCLREERALDEAIKSKKLDVSGISNFGPNHLERSGVESFPAIELEGLYFYPRDKGEELTYDKLCDFLDYLVRKDVLNKIASRMS